MGFLFFHFKKYFMFYFFPEIAPLQINKIYMSILISNETVKQLFHIAQSIARENYNSTYGAPHLLQASVHQDIGLREFYKV